MYTLYKFHFLNGISEINQLFDDILIIWPAPVYIYIYTHYTVLKPFYAFMKCIFIIMYFFNEWIDSDKHVIDQIPENIGIIWEMRKTKTNEVLKGYSIQGKLM